MTEIDSARIFSLLMMKPEQIGTLALWPGDLRPVGKTAYCVDLWRYVEG